MKNKNICSESFLKSFKSIKNESIMDFPNGDSLCPEVWVKNGESYTLADNARVKIETIINMIGEFLGVEQFDAVHIIGSICSNLYTDDSDIDLHFVYGNNGEDLTEKIKDVRDYFKTHASIDLKMIGNHPIELYLQNNKFFDMMSVGCYDVLSDKWESYPIIYNKSYNPYSEYFIPSYKHISTMLSETHSAILKCCEIAFVINEISKNNLDVDSDIISTFADSIEYSADLLNKIKEARTYKQPPISKEDAKIKKVSTEWHVMDASFKLLGKYGYLTILKKISDIKNDIETEESLNIVDIANEILNTFKNEVFKQS